MDWLRDRLISIYEDRMPQYVSEPWEARNKYIQVINDRSAGNVNKFLSDVSGKELSYDEKVIVLKLLEMQRNAMLMYTSCGWFFDEISGIETVQIMQYAARAIQLAKEIDNKDFEPGFTDILGKAPTNIRNYTSGKDVYDALVKTNNIDLNRVGAHLAVSSIFEEYEGQKDIYCYSTQIETYDRIDAGIQVLATGRATVQSNIVLEKHKMDFAVLHLGDHNLVCAANARSPDKVFNKMKEDLKTAFSRGDITEVMRVMNISFEGNNYSLWHLFKDQQRRILYGLLESTWQEIESSFRHIYEHNCTIMQIMHGMHIPLPKALSAPAEFILNHDLCRIIQAEKIDDVKLKKVIDEGTRLSLQLDATTLRFEASRKINTLMDKFAGVPDDIELLETITATLGILLGVITELDLQTAQNVLFDISKAKYPAMTEKAKSEDQFAKRWCEHFRNLANYLGVTVD
jgi:hypothetical protein